MSLADEIQQYFAVMKGTPYSARPLTQAPAGFPAWVVRHNGDFGVAVEATLAKPVNEDFSDCHFLTDTYVIQGADTNMLILCSSYEPGRLEFAYLCLNFLAPEERQELTTEPLTWWERWKKLVGNSSTEKMVYDTIAEMCALDTVFTNDKTAEWTSLHAGTHDIECQNESFEVKSTVERYKSEIDISGQFQLVHNHPLTLLFCRMEKSTDGASINDLKSQLISHGYNADLIEEHIVKKGFPYGASARDKKYKILEKKKYAVDGSFPQITPSSFVNGTIPTGIEHITYTVNLANLNDKPW